MPRAKALICLHLTIGWNRTRGLCGSDRQQQLHRSIQLGDAVDLRRRPIQSAQRPHAGIASERVARTTRHRRQGLARGQGSISQMKFRILGQNVANAAWNGSGQTLNYHDSVIMPQTPNGSMVLGYWNLSKQNNDGELTLVSSLPPQPLDVPAG